MNIGVVKKDSALQVPHSDSEPTTCGMLTFSMVTISPSAIPYFLLMTLNLIYIDTSFQSKFSDRN